MSKTRITGTGKLKSQLIDMASRMVQAGEQAEREGAEDVRDNMQAFVPVDSGHLRDSIRIEQSGPGLDVGPGDEIEYAMYVEYGTSEAPAQPYAGPAADRARTAFVDTVRDTVKKVI